MAARPVKLQKANKAIISELADKRAVVTIYTPKGRLDYLAAELMLSRKGYDRHRVSTSGSDAAR